MRVTIEFYRTRPEDDAHAVLARVVRDVGDLVEAVDLARSLVLTLEMPQQPDAVMITNPTGDFMHRMSVHPAAASDGAAPEVSQ